MSEENNDGETGENGSAPQPPAPAPAGVTQEDLTTFRNGLFGDMRKMVEGIISNVSSKQEPPAPVPKGDEGLAELRQQLADRDYRDSFRDAAQDAGLTRDARSLLEIAAMAKRPDNIGEFIAKHAGAFGKPVEGDTTKPVGGAAPVTPSQPPASDGGTPSATSAGTTSDDIMRWTQEDYQRHFDMHAPYPANRYDIRNREFHKKIRIRAEAAMAKTKVYIGPKR